MVEQIPKTFQKPKSFIEKTASDKPIRMNPLHFTLQKIAENKNQFSLPDLRVSAAIAGLESPAKVLTSGISDEISETLNLNSHFTNKFNEKKWNQKKTIKQALIIANKEKKNFMKIQQKKELHDFINIHNYASGELTPQDVEAKQVRTKSFLSDLRVKKQQILDASPEPDSVIAKQALLQDETISGKSITMELPNKFYKDNLFKAWKAETQDLIRPLESPQEVKIQAVFKQQQDNAQLKGGYFSKVQKINVIKSRPQQSYKKKRPNLIVSSKETLEHLEKLIKSRSQSTFIQHQLSTERVHQEAQADRNGQASPIKQNLLKVDEILANEPSDSEVKNNISQRYVLKSKFYNLKPRQSIKQQDNEDLQQLFKEKDTRNHFKTNGDELQNISKPPKNPLKAKLTSKRKILQEALNQNPRQIQARNFQNFSQPLITFERRSQSQGGQADKSSAAPASIPYKLFDSDNTVSPFINQSVTAAKALKLIEKQQQFDLSRKILEREKKRLAKNFANNKNLNTDLKQNFKVPINNGIIPEFSSMKLQFKAYLEDEQRIRQNQLPPYAQSQGSGDRQKILSEDDQINALQIKPINQLSSRKSPLKNQAKIPATYKQNLELHERMSNFDFCSVFIQNSRQVNPKFNGFMTFSELNKNQLNVDLQSATYAIEDNKDTCNCNSTNKELVQLIVQSPLLLIIEKVYKKNRQNFQERPQEYEKERADIQVLDQLLEQILTGKYKMLKSKIKLDKLGYKHSDKYLNGLDLKKILLGSSEQVSHHTQHTPTSAYHAQKAFQEESEKWFDLNEIRAQESWLVDILTKSKDEIRMEENEMLTFLTQNYQHKVENGKDDKFGSKIDPEGFLKADQQFSQWVKRRSVTASAKDYLEKEEDRVKVKQKLTSFKDDLILQFKDNTEQIKTLIDDVGKTCDSYFQEKIGTNLFEKDIISDDKASLDQMLYLCFLEVVRQVSAQSKAQALLLLKIWHSYHEQTHIKISNSFVQIKNQLKHFHSKMTSLLSKYSETLQDENKRDEEFIRMKDRYQKCLHLIEVSSQNTYIQEQRGNMLQQQLSGMDSKIEVFFPNFSQYYNNEALASKLLKFSTEKNIGLSKDHPLWSLKPQFDAQEKDFPKEAAIIEDLNRIKICLNSNMVDGFLLQNKLKENEQMQNQILSLNKKLEELKEELNRITTVRFKVERELKKKEEEFLDEKRKLRQDNEEDILKACLKQRNDITNDIMSNIKVVQTDFWLLDEYFEEIERSKRLTYDLHT